MNRGLVLFRCCLICIVVLSLPQVALAKRVALVVGNAAYADQPLKNPVNDAKAVSSKLKGLGFEVILVENLKKREVGRTLAGFAQKISRDDEVVVFYAGHGLQVRGENYLPTVDAKIESEEDVETNSLKLGDLLSKLDESRARVKIVILDACRNNPYSKGFRSLDRGLARVQDAPSGTLMHFATRPGQVAADGEGGNGLYTTELLKVLDKPGIAVEQLFKQVSQAVVQSSREQQEPWQEGSLRGEFYFASAVAPAIAAKPNPVQEPPKADAEQEAWELAKKRDNFEAYQGYLSEFPKGRYAAAARSALKGLIPSKILAKDQPSPLAAPIAPRDAEQEAWELAKKRDSTQAYQAYLKEFPSGRYASAARSAISGFAPQTPAQAQIQAPATTQRPSASPDTSVLSQAQLVSDAPKPGEVFKDCEVCPEMVTIPSGSFFMGSPQNESGRSSNEGPQRQVQVKQFAMGRHEVTQRQWQALMGDNPSGFNTCGDNCPIENISWDDAKAFTRKLSQMTGKTYRLPSEEEWEFAARAGCSTPFNLGGQCAERVEVSDANFNGNFSHNGSNRGVDRHTTTAVGSFRANNWGLYDMHGNVWEWVLDCYEINERVAQHEHIQAQRVEERSCKYRGIRGGAWNSFPQYLRSASRFGQATDTRDFHLGFRISRSVP